MPSWPPTRRRRRPTCGSSTSRPSGRSGGSTCRATRRRSTAPARRRTPPSPPSAGARGAVATRNRSLLFALAAFGAAAAEQLPSLPPPGAPLHWSISTGGTVSPSSDAIALALGWPGARFDYPHGLSNRPDLGLRIELLYVEENTNNSKFGFGIGAPLRLVMTPKGNLLLGVHVDPGLRVYTNSNQTDLDLRAPVGGIPGIQATAQLRLAVAADLHLALQTQHRP